MNEENRLLNEQIIILEQQLYDLSEKVNLIDCDLGLVKNDVKNIATKQPTTRENTSSNMNTSKNITKQSQSILEGIKSTSDDLVKYGLGLPPIIKQFIKIPKIPIIP